MTRAALLAAWPETTGRDVVGAAELQAVAALLGEGSVEDARALLFELYRRPLTAAALETGNARAVVEALGWEDAAAPTAEEVFARAALEARSLGEPLHVELDSVAPEEQRDRVLTVDGWMLFEEDYLPRVVTGENGHAHPEALKAQAIAARTYVLRAMRDHKALGRTVPIINSQKFQVYARSAFASCVAAVADTRGILARYQGSLILGNYVAGALWTTGKPGADPTHTERWVTYNEGKTGRFVQPTRLSDTRRADNRGCMGQNCADWLARNGRRCPEILRFFYGADLELGASVGTSSTTSTPPTKPAAERSDPIPGLAAAAAVFQWLFRGGVP
ncbi:SpoIID/LytB domain-containing protein [Polyangium jinanense]|uniref:Sporulation stage II protein D amidase enhancer LytB N-terminal domain-containing protein n=1 Tax=Polyangium jinanense TaxID=2829994 RepID=A0A9X3XFY2_9BACT|nr:SpoIID/LytB domain-containing protein [Polyangium jinanense]MDC3988680.1 hypothetical protein [Polyangium jinanense]